MAMVSTSNTYSRPRVSIARVGWLRNFGTDLQWLPVDEAQGKVHRDKWLMGNS